jgi:hypothetical protein
MILEIFLPIIVPARRSLLEHFHREFKELPCPILALFSWRKGGKA